MIKIKKVKQFSQKELIQYLLDQEDVKVGFDDYEFYYDENGKVTTTIEPIITGNFDFIFNYKENCLEMLVEEEVTEDTEIPTLMVVYDFPGEKDIYCNTYYNLSIKYILDAKNNEANIKSFHMVNQDGTLTLLWTREGGMQ